MSYDYEYEFGISNEAPRKRRYPKGLPWCGSCHTYHSLETGCDEPEEDDRDDY